MSEAIETYLDRVMVYANRAADDEPRVRRELRDHLLTRVDREERSGASREDAVFRALESMGSPRVVGYGLRPKLPWVDVRTHGMARGVIAVGPRAVGVVACGGVAVGVFSFGGVSVGVFGMGGIVAGLLYAWGGVGFALLGLAYVGMGLGVVAAGGGVAGLIAYGGLTWQWMEAGWAANHLPWLDALAQDGRTWLGLSVGNLVVFALVYVAMSRLSWSEKTRMRRADPRLVE